MAMAQIDPSIYDAILGYGQQTASLDPQIAYQQEIAKQLREYGKTPDVRMSGRRAVAPSPWEYLGAAANRGVASSRDQQAMNLQQQQAALRQLQTQKVLDALRMGQPQTPEQPFSVPGSTPQAGV